MLNLIPALLLFLTSGPFGPAVSDAVARVDSAARVVRVAALAKELELAGLTAAQAVLVIASCKSESSSKEFEADTQPAVSFPPILAFSVWASESARFRDGPRS